MQQGAVFIEEATKVCFVCYMLSSKWQKDKASEHIVEHLAANEPDISLRSRGGYQY